MSRVLSNQQREQQQNSSPTLLPFQIEGADWLTRGPLRLLADEMRLGKSPQTVTACDYLGLKRILVICPAVARINWAREFELWSVFPRAPKPLLSFSEHPAEGGVVTCSYEYASQFPERLSYPKDVIVIDEVHFTKSTETLRSEAIFGREGIVRSAKRVWALSATPAPNHAGELWVLLYTFGVTPLSHESFVERYCDVVVTGYGRGYKIVGTKKAMIPEIRSLLKKIMLRRKMKEVRPDAKEPLFSTFVVEPGSIDGLIDLTAELEEALKKQKGLIGGVLDSRSLTDDEKLRMLEGLAGSVSTLRRYHGLQKVAPTLELIASEIALKSYEKIVVFAIHRGVVDALARGFRKKGFGVVVLNGDSTPNQKQRAQEDFNAKKEVQIFIGNIISAGTNITLAAAHDVLVVESDWVPGNNAQAVKRCGHILKLNEISVRFVALANPLEERVTRVIEKKTRELAEIFDG